MRVPGCSTRIIAGMMISNEDDLLLPGFAKVLCNTRFRAVWVSVKAILTNGP